MPKHVIIDGYNLLGVLHPGSVGRGNDGEAKRERLLQDLAKYQHHVRHKMTVVFDAWRQAGGTQHHEHRAGVTVIFTQQGELADQVIQRMVRSRSQEYVVVSSDHEIINTAKAHGALVLRSQEFSKKLQSDSLTPHSQFPMNPMKKDDSDITRRPNKKGNPRKLPKAARQRLRNLKKF